MPEDPTTKFPRVTGGFCPFFGLGVKVVRTACFRRELAIQIPFWTIGIGLGKRQKIALRRRSTAGEAVKP